MNTKLTVILSCTKECKTKQHTFLYPGDSKKSKRFNELLLIICLILTSKALWSYIENAPQKIIHFWLLIPFFHFFSSSKKSVGITIESNHDRR